MKKIKPDNKRTIQVLCLFKPEEKILIKEAIAKASAADKVKCSFSHFLRRSALHNAEIITGKRIAP